MLKVGDEVLVKAPKVNKLSSYYEPVPYKVTNIKGSMISAARSDGTRSFTCNVSFLSESTPSR